MGVTVIWECRGNTAQILRKPGLIIIVVLLTENLFVTELPVIIMLYVIWFRDRK